jgi:hypothetical protein
MALASESTPYCRPYSRMVDRFRHRGYQRWHRQQSKGQILRSQLGFSQPFPAPPDYCQQCNYYHGCAYGTTVREFLVCALHPTGWLEASRCPDWHIATEIQ